LKKEKHQSEQEKRWQEKKANETEQELRARFEREMANMRAKYEANIREEQELRLR
jgi:hypothetical protein